MGPKNHLKILPKYDPLSPNRGKFEVSLDTLDMIPKKTYISRAWLAAVHAAQLLPGRPLRLPEADVTLLPA